MRKHTKIHPIWPYFEGTVFVAIAAAIDYWIFPASSAFRGMPFNLLWVPIILIAGRYGTAPGVFTGFIASCYYMYAISIENFFYGDFEYALSDKIQIFSFLFFAAVFGQMYDRILNKYLILISEHEDLTEQHKNLLAHYEVLEKVNEKLEKRMIRRDVTINSLYEMAKNLESLEEKDLYVGVSDLMKRFIQAEKGAIYLLDNNGKFEPKSYFGYEANVNKILKAKIENNKLIRKALADGKTLSFRNGFDSQFTLPPEEKCLIAAPVVIGAENKIVGLITVDQAPFLSLNSSNVRILGIIADWLSNAIQKSKFVGKIKENEIDDDASRTFSYAFFKARLSEEASRFMRSDTPFTVALLRIDDFNLIDDAQQKKLLRKFGDIFKRSIRYHDIICRYKISGVFAFIFPLADESDGIFHLSRLIKNIEAEDLRPFQDGKKLETTLIIQTVKEDKPMRLYRLKPNIAAEMIEEHIDSLLKRHDNN